MFDTGVFKNSKLLIPSKGFLVSNFVASTGNNRKTDFKLTEKKLSGQPHEYVYVGELRTNNAGKKLI
jgi:hypothetical protein